MDPYKWYLKRYANCRSYMNRKNNRQLRNYKSRLKIKMDIVYVKREDKHLYQSK